MGLGLRIRRIEGEKMMKSKLVGIILMIIFITGCASTIPEIKLMPKASDSVFPFFTSGQPIAAVQSADAFMLLALERTTLGYGPYFRLWILYHNISEKPYLLEPQRFVSLNVTSISKRTVGKSYPESPTKMLAAISNEKAISMIMQAIGGTLQEMTVKPTTAETRSNGKTSATTTFNDQKEKQDMVADRTSLAMTNTALWYDIYRNSLSDGILRRNTVFPGQSVNGYIYFPYPIAKKSDYKDNEGFPSNLEYFLKVELELSGESLNIYFTPIAGE